MKTTDAPLLETSEAARLLKLSAPRVRQLADSGVLAVALKTSSGQRLFDRAEIERFRLKREGK
jgi:excisionase family DNA binding protein